MLDSDTTQPEASELFAWWHQYCTVQEAFAEADASLDTGLLDRVQDDWEDLKIDAAYLLAALLKDDVIRHELLARLS